MGVAYERDTWCNSNAEGKLYRNGSPVHPLMYPITQFMAWERSFEKRVMKIRAKELKYQKLNYTIEVRLSS